jgi:hypothetical protein
VGGPDRDSQVHGPSPVRLGYGRADPPVPERGTSAQLQRCPARPQPPHRSDLQPPAEPVAAPVPLVELRLRGERQLADAVQRIWLAPQRLLPLCCPVGRPGTAPARREQFARPVTRAVWGVEVRGFEPLTSSVRGRRSAGLSYTPG